jgi:hypothetical protein
MELSAGDILHALCIFTKPQPKYKYVVCICPIYPLFFLINSSPRKSTSDAQILIKKDEFSFLDHDSYINTATPCTIYQNEIDNAEKVGFLTKNIKSEIIEVVKKCRYLPQAQKELIEKNFSAQSSS